MITLLTADASEAVDPARRRPEPDSAQTAGRNRFQPGHAGLAGTLVMTGLFVLDVTGRPALTDLIPAARGAALRACQNAHGHMKRSHETLRLYHAPPPAECRRFRLPLLVTWAACGPAAQ
jgi:hypothetical protein